MIGPSACPACLRRSWLLARLAPCIEKCNSNRAGARTPDLLSLEDESLARAVAPRRCGEILEAVESIPEVELKARVEAAGCWACCRHDERYPDGLREFGDSPRALIGVGDPDRLARLGPDSAVTVVGARKATAYGLEASRRLGRELAAAGLAVVSGMAFGIDGAAHRGALERGMTVAVLGSGADRAYPAAHRRLHERIAADGLVLSEMPPGAAPWKWCFPARNRIMAELGRMTVLVEAAERSGSLITAEMAADAGREVGAVPGSIDSGASRGTNALLASGAAVVRGAQDVLDRVLGVGVAEAVDEGPEIDGLLASALEAVEDGCAECAELSTALGIGGPAAAAALARLEVLGYLEGSVTGAYRPTGLRAPYASSRR